ncbi:hypothetical protein QUF76_18405 [Desulfobacterales bacterium HSG16]|nr:hypothetical protein [Desulfobacterales bacterium HSG16]
MDNLYYNRFKSLWKALGSISESQKEFKELISAYGQNHRAYHTFDHIKADKSTSVDVS